MIDQEMAQGDFGSMEHGFAGLADGGWGLLLLVREEARAVLARAREDAAIEAQDVLSQADEALVMG